MNGELTNPYEDKILGPLIHDRQSELNLFTEIISIVSANQFCPAIRFPNSVMLHHDKLKNITNLIKSTKPNAAKKLNKKLISYSDSLKRDITDVLLNCAFKDRGNVLAVCDFPVEWVSMNGIPVMFSHEISRIPSTPGNLFSQVALSGQRVILPYKSFSEILVIRSFAESDPIKDHLKIAIETFEESNSYENISIRIVDINSEKELIDELNKYSGILVVFDCHGNHGGEKAHGWLNIGKEKVNVWGLANRCRIPPIVVLSACSTHPIDGSHASVANGFFKSGALSVIGTYAPVEALHAGQFVARLLYRISAFVPLVLSNAPTTWREIVSGFLRMSYTTDVLRGMTYIQRIITEDQYMNIRVKANFIINSFHPNWFEEFMNVIESEVNLSRRELDEIIQKEYQFVETMLFSQLGRPENILICKDDA